jgi:hypothetical protein
MANGDGPAEVNAFAGLGEGLLRVDPWAGCHCSVLLHRFI